MSRKRGSKQRTSLNIQNSGVIDFLSTVMLQLILVLIASQTIKLSNTRESCSNVITWSIVLF